MQLLAEISNLSIVLKKESIKKELNKKETIFLILETIDSIYQNPLFGGIDRKSMFNLILVEFEFNADYHEFKRKYLETLNRVVHFKSDTIELNLELIQSNDLTKQQIENILELHRERMELFYSQSEFDNRIKLNIFNDLVEKIEFALQKEWGFDINRDYHTWWFQVPNCTCSKHINMATFGKPERFVNDCCPIHRDVKITDHIVNTLPFLNKKSC